MVLISSIAAAGEITREQHLELWDKNKDVYENVEEGMTAEYYSNSFSKIVGQQEVECFQHLKEVVVSAVNAEKYLVYSKTTAMNDCLDVKKGKVSELLNWRERDYLVAFVPSDKYKIKYHRITLSGTISTSEATVTYTDGREQRNIKRQIDHSKSQFYNTVEWKSEKDFSRLLRRSVTDPTTIDFDNLQIHDL